MCGIGAIILREGNGLNIAKQILVGQENRGASSSGVAFANGNEIKIIKDVKSPTNFVKDLNFRSKMIITHSRAPSVGSVKIENAHPFLSCDKEFALVHNGTFLSHRLLREVLSNSHEIKGETDSEMICHFVEEYGKSKGYEKILQCFGGQKIILLFKDKVIGFGEFYIVKDENGVYVVQEEEVFDKIFKGQRKVLYELDGTFVCDKNLNLKFYGKVEKNRKVFGAKKRYVISDWRDWFAREWYGSDYSKVRVQDENEEQNEEDISDLEDRDWW